MHPTLEKLLSAGPVVTDGAWGTQLQLRGLPIGECPDHWNLSHPEKVEEVARAYVEAGSQIILTNTFGANRFILERQNLAARAGEINRAGVAISKRAAAGRAKVFASVGPSGKMLMMGEVSEADLLAAFVEQTRQMAIAGADGIVIETMADLAETKIAIAAAKETGLPVVACMTFDSGANHDRTMMGVTPEQAAEGLAAAGADAIGSNCGQGIAGFVAICRRLKAALASRNVLVPDNSASRNVLVPDNSASRDVLVPDNSASRDVLVPGGNLPIWIKANAGLPQMKDDKTIYAQTPAEFAAFIPELLEAGASFIGGCCGTSPEFVRAVKEKLEKK